MKDSYRKIKEEFKEIETQLTSILLRDGDLGNANPEEVAMFVRLFKLVKASDEFACKCIETIESQNRKLDKILEKVSKKEEEP